MDAVYWDEMLGGGQRDTRGRFLLLSFSFSFLMDSD
jgi:hypothetical protein